MISYQFEVSYRATAVSRGCCCQTDENVDAVTDLMLNKSLGKLVEKVPSFCVLNAVNSLLLSLIQSEARLLADLNLAPSALRWWEKGWVCIIGKGTSQNFVSP